MIKVSEHELVLMEQDYPNIRSMIESAEQSEYPDCPRCGSPDHVALVIVGVIGRTMALVSATSRRKLIPNGDSRGRYFCNRCQTRFSILEP